MKHYQIRRRVAAEDYVVEEWSDDNPRPEVIDSSGDLAALQGRWSAGPAWHQTTEEERARDPLLAHVLYLG